MEVSAAFAQATQLHQQGDLIGALAIYDQVLAANPDSAEALLQRAEILAALQRHEDALIAVDRLLKRDPVSAPALRLRGQSRFALKQYERAFHDLAFVAALDPDAKYIPGMAFNLSQRICAWSDNDARLADLQSRVDAGKPVVTPFQFLTVPSSPEQQKTCAVNFFRKEIGGEKRPAATPSRAHGKIRLGYFSADFREHATSHLINGLFKAHDRSRFEVVAFAFGGDPRDPVRHAIARNVDRLFDVSAASDSAIVDLATSQEIDVAIDLNVYMDRQPAIFAKRVAPIQVNYLGYAGTSGAPCYDYIIGDSIVTPAVHQAHFSETIVTLPHAYQPTAFKGFTELQTPTREALGLPPDGFVFCCLNGSLKITPDVFDVWMRLLQAVEGSVLWLLGKNDAAISNLRLEAARRGVSRERLVFAPQVSTRDHIARYAAADLFLDTFHYNAHTTASDALWAGLPLLGDTFPARVAASLVTAAGLPELVTQTTEAYEQRALELARQPALLKAMRERLTENKLSCPLFDTARYTRNIEAAYTQMWRRYQAGQAPAAITVSE